ncbi:lipoprotein [Spiroplasma endosymbiont of Atherix ibis]
MKKLLSLISTIILEITTSNVVISCKITENN